MSKVMTPDGHYTTEFQARLDNWSGIFEGVRKQMAIWATDNELDVRDVYLMIAATSAEYDLKTMALYLDAMTKQEVNDE